MNKNLAKANIISDHYFIPTAKAVGYSDYVEGLAKANNIFAFNIPPDKSGGYSNPTAKAVGYSNYGEGLAKANNKNDQYSFFPPDKSGGYSNPHPHPDKSGGNSNPHPHPDKSGGYSEYKSNYYH